MYYNYHAKIKRLISQGDLTEYRFFEDWNGIKPALVLFFLSHKPMPIRQNRWEEYFEILKKHNLLD